MELSHHENIWEPWAEKQFYILVRVNALLYQWELNLRPYSIMTSWVSLTREIWRASDVFLRWSRLRNKHHRYNWVYLSIFLFTQSSLWHLQWVWKCKSAILSGFITVRYLFGQSDRRMITRSRMLIDCNGSGLAPLSVICNIKITHK